MGRRPDGYHELRTIYQSVNLFDELWVESASDGILELRVEPEGVVSARDDNLVLRAASVLRQRSGVKTGARLRLAKKIPVGAGLGGGSADAAAALVILDILWDLGLSFADLTEIAASLGSDVPFFLHGGLALGKGRGDRVCPLPDLEPLGVLLVKPPIQVATGEVFDRLPARLTWRRQGATVDAVMAGGSRGIPWRDLRNDLEPVVFDHWPEVGQVVEALRDMRPLHAGMSGAGATGFAVFPDAESARLAARNLDGEWWAHAGGTLDRESAQITVIKEDTQREEGP
jgi:4-diphosphocytidyl-2-C-methyl-D-erythritol kinase